jgi:hypothetical protein
MSNPIVGPRRARCRVCGGFFITGSRGPIAARCRSCQRKWTLEFQRSRPVQTKAERAAFYARKKAEGNLRGGKVKRGRPIQHRPESRTKSATRDQAILMSQADSFYR